MVVRRLWAWYGGMLRSHPYPTNALTSASIVFSGDAVAQFYDMRSKVDRGAAKPYDPTRGLILGAFQIVIATPFWLRVYRKLDGIFPPTPTILSAIQKGAMTWLVATSTMPFFIGYVATAHSVLEGRGVNSSEILEVVRTKIKNDMMRILPASLTFWPLHWIPMFYLLPREYRFVYVSCQQLIWSAIVSYIVHDATHHAT